MEESLSLVDLYEAVVEDCKKIIEMTVEEKLLLFYSPFK